MSLRYFYETNVWQETSYAECHKYPSDGLVADTRPETGSWTDFVSIKGYFTSWNALNNTTTSYLAFLLVGCSLLFDKEDGGTFV